MDVGEEVEVELNGECNCGARIVFRGIAVYGGRLKIDGLQYDAFEFSPPIRCKCGEEIAAWLSQPL